MQNQLNNMSNCFLYMSVQPSKVTKIKAINSGQVFQIRYGLYEIFRLNSCVWLCVASRGVKLFDIVA